MLAPVVGTAVQTFWFTNQNFLSTVTMTHAILDDSPNQMPTSPRRLTPRNSLIVVLPENHTISPAGLADRLPRGDTSDVDVIVACAGQPVNLHALQRTVSDAQFLLAPAGTSMEDLRELALQRAPGDIVTLLSGALIDASASEQAEILKSS